MTSSLPSLIAMYAKAAMPTRTKTPTMSSSFVSCMGTGPPGLPGGDNFGPGPDSNELPHGGMPGPLELFRRRHLDDHPVQQHRDVSRDPEDLGDSVAHHDGREPELPRGLDDQIIDGSRQEGIQAGGGLVEQDDFRTHDERTGQPGPLPHAAAEFRGEFVPHACESDRLQHLKDLPFDLRVFHFCLLPQGKGNVSKTLSESNSAALWNSIANFFRTSFSSCEPSLVISISSTSTCPRSGFRSPIMCLSNTLLPPPLLPITVVTFPRGTSRFTPCRTGCPPSVFSTPLRRITGVDAAPAAFVAANSWPSGVFIELTLRPRSRNSPR